MTASVLTAPRFRRGQTAYFVGGIGTIRSCQPESGSWSYLVEMEMGPEPEIGRIGCETMVCLFEADLTVKDEPRKGRTIVKDEKE